MKEFTEAELTDIADMVTGYGDGESKVFAKYKLKGPRLNELMLDRGIEKCPCCHWFAETWEMIPDDEEDPDGHCTNCRVRKEEPEDE